MMSNIGMEASNPNHEYDDDDIYLSDDDDWNEAYEEAMANPMLSSLLNCNKPPYRIVTITQPRVDCNELQPVDSPTLTDVKEPISQQKFDELASKVAELSLCLSTQKDEVAWLVTNKQEMQNHIDSIYEIFMPSKEKVRIGISRPGDENPEAQGLPGSESGSQRRSVSTQTEQTEPPAAPPASNSSHTPLQLTISLHGVSLTPFPQ